MRGATRAAVGQSVAWHQGGGRPTVDVVHHGLAVGLALASAVCYAVSAALQHHEAARQSGNGLHLVRALLRRPAWCAAVLASLLGALLHVGALGAGPLVLVQPLGVTALVFALPIGARLGRVRVSAWSWRDRDRAQLLGQDQLVVASQAQVVFLARVFDHQLAPTGEQASAVDA